jgi:hypothetical protein
MLRTTHMALFGIFAAISANAGQIQIGGPNGLTSAYVTSPGGWGQRPYVGSLFSNTTSATPGLPTTTNVTGNNAGPQTLTDSSGIVFNMMNDGPAANTSSYNYVWASQTSGAANAINIPVNVFGVQNVYVMLNDYAGYAGMNATIAFNFASGTDTITLANLANGLGAFRSAVQCTSATGTISCPSATPNGHTVSASAPGTVNTNVSGDATITTKSVWSGSYAGGPTGFNNDYISATGSSSGNLTLDELSFSFSTNYSNTTLQSISITAGNVTGSVPGTLNDRLGLSAITVVATPEPTTVVLFGTGLALIGFGRLTRKRA